MAFDAGDKSFLTKSLLLTWAGISVLAVVVGPLVAGFALRNTLKDIVNELRSPNLGFLGAQSGDTPVVLVGGSLMFRAGKGAVVWQATPPVSPSTKVIQYSVTPDYQVASIAVKAKPDSDPNDDNPAPASDGKLSSDLFRVDVPNGTTWEVDEFTDASDQPVASITPVSGDIVLKLLDTSGFLCPQGNKNVRILYGKQSDCSDAVNFTKVSLTVTANGVTQANGTLVCVDLNNKPNHCRIVFRGPAS